MISVNVPLLFTAWTHGNTCVARYGGVSPEYSISQSAIDFISLHPMVGNLTYRVFDDVDLHECDGFLLKLLISQSTLIDILSILSPFMRSHGVLSAKLEK